MVGDFYNIIVAHEYEYAPYTEINYDPAIERMAWGAPTRNKEFCESSAVPELAARGSQDGGGLRLV